MAYEIPTIHGIDLAGIDRAVTQNKLYQMQMEAAKRQDEQATQKQNALKAMMDSLPADQRLLATIAPEKWAERQADPFYGTKAVGNSLYTMRDGKPVRVAGGITLEGMDTPMAPMGSAPTSGPPAPSAAVPAAKVPEVFREAIAGHAERTGLDPELFGRVIGAESAGNPNAVSNKGAAGLAQVMPGTGRDPGYGVQPIKDSTPDENLRFGADYLKAMSDRYSGNVPVALAAYNWGPGNVDKWLEAGADPRKLPAETQAYIAKITGRPFSGLTQTAQAGGTATDAGGGAGSRPRLFIDENGKPISAGDGLVWAQNAQGQRVAVPAPGSEVRDLTPAEIKARGLKEGTLAQIDGKGKVTVVKEGRDGPINASGLDAAMLNIVLQGDPGTPEYAAAYAHLTQPKPMQTQLPDGTVQMVMVTPSLPPNIRKPAWMDQGGNQPAAAPAAPSSSPAQPQPATPAPAQQGAGPQQGNGYTVTPITGATRDPKFTEGETNAYGFQQRMRSAENTIRDLEAKGYTQPGLKDRAAEAIPVIGHGLTSSDYQQFDSAKRDFITAVLRKESGAAIGAEEYATEEKKYFPMPGDKPPVIEQKRIARQNAIKAMQAAAQGPMKFYDGRPGAAAPVSAGVPPLPPGFEIIGGQ